MRGGNKEMDLLPFTWTTEGWGVRLAVGMVAIDLAGGILGRIPGSSDGQTRSRPVHQTRRRLFSHFGSGRYSFRGGDEDRWRPTGTFASWTWVVCPVAHIAIQPPLRAGLGCVEEMLSDLLLQRTTGVVHAECRSIRYTANRGVRRDGREIWEGGANISRL